ncbi:MAG: transketolase family protein [Planctomycetaceae bacterium]|nr:transketolase family protein [Planctomycetaceae bacterium]
MINKIQIKTWAKLGHRGTLGTSLLELASNLENLMVLTADLSTTSGLTRFEQTYPDKFLNMGIAEQNMVGVAAGLAKEGYITFTTTFATFATMRSCEQIRNYLGYMEFNVKIVGMASGFSMGMFGNTHYAIEDIALMRSIPNITIISPSDCFEVNKSIFAVALLKGPVYLRLSGTMNTPIIYQDDYEFEVGRSIILRGGDDVVIIACGTMVSVSLSAAKILESVGISAAVINMHTIKPIDKQAIASACESSRLLVTVEEHNIIGGLGSAVAEYKSTLKNTPPQLFIGIPDTFCKPGDYQYLLNHFGLTPESIAQKIQEHIH